MRKLRRSPEHLLCALIDQESKGDKLAFREEPEFCKGYILASRSERKKLDEFSVLHGYANQSEASRAYCSSYGLLQIMYPSARLEGFGGDPEELFDPATNLTIGIRHLVRAFAKGEREYPEWNDRERFLWALRRWNGSGKNRDTLCYALEVENIYEDLLTAS